VQSDTQGVLAETVHVGARPVLWEYVGRKAVKEFQKDALGEGQVQSQQKSTYAFDDGEKWC